MRSIVIKAAVFILVAAKIISAADVPIVTTKNGKLRGTVTFATDLPDKTVFSFLGVPYATPPTEELRFQPPLPSQPWTDEREATQYGPHCAQDLDLLFTKFFHIRPPHNTTSEDCLYLNVFTPTLENTEGSGLPVLVWFHGGGFSFGTGALYPGTALSAHQDLVVVTINYRLGAFGFLSTGDSQAPGNYGLLDQVEALKWVRDNIKSFAGDPKSVTIGGQLGGAASVSYHLLSPASNGLFHRAISHSGVATSFPHAEHIKPRNEFLSQAKSVGCKKKKETEEILQCLRSKSSEDIVKSRKGEIFARCMPNTDGTFLKDSPKSLLNKGEFAKVDYLLGVTSAEFGHILPSLLSDEFGKGKFPSEVKSVLIGYANMLYKDTKRIKEIHEALTDEYLSGLSGDKHEAERVFTDLQADTFVIAPTIDMADRHAAAGANVYLYEFRHHLSLHRWESTSTGAEHGDELPFLFGVPFLKLSDPNNAGNEMTFTGDEKRLSLDMMAYWGNFIRTGDPSNQVGAPESGRRDLTTWPVYTSDDHAYLKLDVTSSVDVGLRRRQATLWNKILPEMADDAAQDKESKDEL